MERLAGSLAERGVRSGSVLAGFFDKSTALVTTFLAAARLGAAFAPLNYKVPFAKLKPTLQALGVGAFFTELDHLPLLSALRPLIATEAPLVVLRGDPPIRGYVRYDDLLQRSAPAPEPPAVTDANRVVYLNFTSGTTGQPKPAVTTNGNLAAATAGVCQGLGLGPSDVHLCLFAPYAHPHEIFARALFLGGTAVLHGSMSPKALANVIEKGGVTCLMAVPPLYEISLKPQLLARTYRMGTLRLLEAGGMATPARMVTEFRDRFGLAVRPVWGSTETAGAALASDDVSAPGLLAGALPGFTATIEDERGHAAEEGQPGELVVAGAGVVRGYLGEPSPALHDGVFRTGDVVRRTAEGLVFLGRRDEMRKVGGLKVYPQEIEAQLAALPGVREAAVWFREDRARGLAPVAFVVLEPGSAAPTLADVKRFLRPRVPTGALPRELRLVDELPRTAAGKLDRAAL